MGFRANTRLLVSLNLGALCAAACGRLGYERLAGEPIDARAPAQEGDVAAAADTGFNADARTGSDPDGTTPDALRITLLPEACEDLRSGGVALWPFDDLSGGLATDILGGRNGMVNGGVLLTDGPPGACGRAVRFPAGDTAHILVPHDPVWNLAEGAIDLWVLPGSSTGERALLSRDLRETDESGHFLLGLSEDNVLVVRIQASNANLPLNNVVGLCSEAPLPKEEWTHVAVNFGPPNAELFINGRRNDGRDTEPNAKRIGTVKCGANSAFGIVGNQEPWIFGASNHRSLSGLALGFHASGVQLGRVRIRSQRLPW